MIKVDETDPVGELEPSFPYRDVKIRRNLDMKEFYELQSEIGRGKFGTVYRCREKATNLTLAAKFVGIARRQDRRNVEREVEIMCTLQHPRLIQLYDAFEAQSVMCVIQELIEGGELFERVIDDDFVLTERSCAVFMRQICEGVEFIHSKNFLHLDLKPENILCLTKTGNRIKIIDFGLARKFEPDKKMQVLFGTPEFVAPEVVNFDQISFGTDMWSVGVICYVLLSGLSPFMGQTDVETMANVTIAQYDFDDETFDEISENAKDFIRKLLLKNKERRMSATECLSHVWLRRKPLQVTLPALPVTTKRITPPALITTPEKLDSAKDNLRNLVERWGELPNGLIKAPAESIQKQSDKLLPVLSLNTKNKTESNNNAAAIKYNSKLPTKGPDIKLPIEITEGNNYKLSSTETKPNNPTITSKTAITSESKPLLQQRDKTSSVNNEIRKPQKNEIKNKTLLDTTNVTGTINKNILNPTVGENKEIIKHPALSEKSNPVLRNSHKVEDRKSNALSKSKLCIPEKRSEIVTNQKTSDGEYNIELESSVPTSQKKVIIEPKSKRSVTDPVVQQNEKPEFKILNVSNEINKASNNMPLILSKTPSNAQIQSESINSKLPCITPAKAGNSLPQQAVHKYAETKSETCPHTVIASTESKLKPSIPEQKQVLGKTFSTSNELKIKSSLPWTPGKLQSKIIDNGIETICSNKCTHISKEVVKDNFDNGLVQSPLPKIQVIKQTSLSQIGKADTKGSSKVTSESPVHVPKIITHKIEVEQDSEPQNRVKNNAIGVSPTTSSVTAEPNRKSNINVKNGDNKNKTGQVQGVDARRVSDFLKDENSACGMNGQLSDEIRKLSSRLFQMSSDQNEDYLGERKPSWISSVDQDPVRQFLVNHGVTRRPKFRMSNLNRDVPIGSPPPPSNFSYYMTNCTPSLSTTPCCNNQPNNHAAPSSSSGTSERRPKPISKDDILRLFEKSFQDTPPTPEPSTPSSSINSLASYFQTSNKNQKKLTSVTSK